MLSMIFKMFLSFFKKEIASADYFKAWYNTTIFATSLLSSKMSPELEP